MLSQHTTLTYLFKIYLESLPYLKITTCPERSYSQSSNNSVNGIPKKHFFFNSSSLSCPLPPKSHSKICKGASSITVSISRHSAFTLFDVGFKSFIYQCSLFKLNNDNQWLIIHIVKGMFDLFQKP